MTGIGTDEFRQELVKFEKRLGKVEKKLDALILKIMENMK